MFSRSAMHLCCFTLLRKIDAQFAANFIITLDKYNAKSVCLNYEIRKIEFLKPFSTLKR